MSLESAGSRWTFAFFILLTATGFCWEATRVWLATEFAASANPKLWRRAAQLEPTNAAYWAQLGWMEEWDFERGNLKEAAADYETAVEANPHSDSHWLELAGIYERLGQAARARAAYEKAQYSRPISSAVAWRYGNFLLRLGNTSEACGQFRKALLTDPRLTEDAVTEWWKTGLYASQPIARILPPQNRYYFKALDYFVQQNEIDIALRVWDELVLLGQHFDLPQSLSLTNNAISVGRLGDAQRVWGQALQISGWPVAEENSSLVFNGSFENALANGGFDWREEAVSGVFFSFDTRTFRSGARSLRISFESNSNLDFQHLVQYVLVEPRQRYRFAAYLSSRDLSTDNGIHFAIGDPFYPALSQISTSSVIGTQPWTRVETEFTTSATTHLLKIVLRRTPTLKFDNKFRGTVWVDDVSLVSRGFANKDRDRP